MNQEDAVKIFEAKQVQTVWDEDREEWYISTMVMLNLIQEQVQNDEASFTLQNY